jgi:SynChlorMet cassette protein ScmC
MEEDKFGYKLTLGSGYSWFLSGSAEIVPWIEKFARIMELKQCRPGGYPRITFTAMQQRSKKGDYRTVPLPSILKNITENGWLCYDNNTVRIWHHEHIPDVLCEIKNFDIHEIEIINMWNSLQPIYQRAQKKGGLPLHAALVKVERQGILFAAAGNTGKTTCCSRLPDYLKPLCDDETLIVRDSRKNYHAHPFPSWSDYLWDRHKNTWNVQHSVPLSAIFFLEQSEADKVIPVHMAQSTVLINESAKQVCQKFWRRLDGEEKRKLTEQVFNNACEMAKTIPAYILRVSLSGRFWEEIEKVL